MLLWLNKSKDPLALVSNSAKKLSQKSSILITISHAGITNAIYQQSSHIKTCKAIMYNILYIK